MGSRAHVMLRGKGPWRQPPGHGRPWGPAPPTTPPMLAREAPPAPAKARRAKASAEDSGEDGWEEEAPPAKARRAKASAEDSGEDGWEEEGWEEGRDCGEGWSEEGQEHMKTTKADFRTPRTMGVVDETFYGRGENGALLGYITMRED